MDNTTLLGEIRSWNLQWLEKEGKNTIKKIVSHHHSCLQRKTKFKVHKERGRKPQTKTKAKVGKLAKKPHILPQ